MFIKISTMLLPLLFLGCSIPASNQTQPQDTKVQNESSLQKNYYYALIEKNGDNWQIIDIKNSSIDKRAKSNQDILKISEDYKEVAPAYAKTFPLNASGRFECKTPINHKEYTPCSSSFAQIYQDIETIFKNSSATQLKYLDKELLDKAIAQSNLFKAIDAKKPIFAYEACEHKFREAKTSNDFSLLIEECSSVKNSEQLIALAAKNRDTLKVQEEQRKIHEEQMAKTYELRAQKVLKEAEAENIRLVKIEQKSIDNLTNSIKSFRKGLKKGTQTNCGPVIDIKDSSVQVLFEVKGYGDKHWINIDKIYPKGNGCHFVKGKYLAPPAF